MFEVLGPADRRFGYAFAKCTDCGPRFTIIEGAPYDRAHDQRGFECCASCRAEYAAHTRRFRAEPNACAGCGPRLELLDPTGQAVLVTDPLGETAILLQAQRISAMAHFHLRSELNDEKACCHCGTSYLADLASGRTS